MKTHRNILIMIIVVLLIALVACGGASPYDEQIQLGYKLIDEGKYEEAILAFNAAIEIDAKLPRAYVGLADTYVTRLDDNALADIQDALRRGYEQDEVGNNNAIVDAIIRLADTLVEQGRADLAAQLLDFGYDLTGDERIGAKRTEMIGISDSEFMKNLYALCDAGDYEAVRSIMQTDEFVETALMAPVIYAPGSNGVGIYEMGDAAFVYFGGYDDNIRSGHGVWIEAEDSYLFEGEWANDAPNGRGKHFRDYGDGDVWTMEGYLVDGLWHGDVSDWNSSYDELYFLHYQNGIVTVIEIDNADLPYIVGKTADGAWEYRYPEERVNSVNGIRGYSKSHVLQ